MSSDFSPTLDLYFFHQLGKHQSVTANVVGSSIYTDKRGYNGEEEGDYAYEVNGRTWSLESEAIYENKLKPLPFLQVWNTRCRLRIMNIRVMCLRLTRCGEENFIYSLR